MKAQSMLRRILPKGCKMTRRKVISGTLVIFACLGTFGLLIASQMFDICYYCLQKAENYFSIKYDYKRNTFMTVPEANCKENPPYLVLLVTTTRDQKEARTAIRKTWGRERLIHGKRVVTFFLLGTSINPSSDQASLSEEVTTYKDIILKDFLDSYYNLTIKTLMGLDWIVHYCPQTSYIMKTDTDMFVNTFYLVELLKRKKQTSNLFTGILKLDDPPVRNVFSKWYVSRSEYEGDKYPPFCSGTGYVFSVDVAQKLYNISYTTPFFKLEDVYIGMCLDKLNVSLQKLHTEIIFFATKPPFSVCKYQKLVTSHGVSASEMILYWETVWNARDKKEHC